MTCPVSLNYDVVGCHVLCLKYGIPVWHHIGQNTTSTSKHKSGMTLDV